MSLLYCAKCDVCFRYRDEDLVVGSMCPCCDSYSLTKETAMGDDEKDKTIDKVLMGVRNLLDALTSLAVSGSRLLDEKAASLHRTTSELDKRAATGKK